MSLNDSDLENQILNQMYQFIKNKTDIQPEIGVILGSGWGDCLPSISNSIEISFSEIPFFHDVSVENHAGKILLGFIDDKIPVAVMRGRFHYYEGYQMHEIIRPIRVLKMLGVNNLILTNAAGGINRNYNVGDIVIINDHISSFVPNPLRGENLDSFGERFPDMSEIYNKELISKTYKTAEKVGIILKEGVYLQTCGPSFESPAEIRMYSILGADLVGMSTVCDSIVAVHAGMKVIGLSFVSNMACGISKEQLSIKDVINNANIHKQNMSTLLLSLIKNIGSVD